MPRPPRCAPKGRHELYKLDPDGGTGVLNLSEPMALSSDSGTGVLNLSEPLSLSSLVPHPVADPPRVFALIESYISSNDTAMTLSSSSFKVVGSTHIKLNSQIVQCAPWSPSVVSGAEGGL